MNFEHKLNLSKDLLGALAHISKLMAQPSVNSDVNKNKSGVNDGCNVSEKRNHFLTEILETNAYLSSI